MSERDEPLADGPQPCRHDTLRLLREEASSLMTTIPGPVASMSLRVADCALEVSWARAAPPDTAPGTAQPPVVSATPIPDLPVPEPVAAVADPRLQDVVTPMVGTFYVAPEPGAAPFVQVGDRVEAGQPVGIVEAMKLMNPVPAERSGEVMEVLVGDGEPVEFGQPLVRILVDAP